MESSKLSLLFIFPEPESNKYNISNNLELGFKSSKTFSNNFTALLYAHPSLHYFMKTISKSNQSTKLLSYISLKDSNFLSKQYL